MSRTRVIVTHRGRGGGKCNSSQEETLQSLGTAAGRLCLRPRGRMTLRNHLMFWIIYFPLKSCEESGAHERAYAYIKEHGIATANSYPYMTRLGQCHPLQHIGARIKGAHTIQEGDENELKEAVALKVKNDINTDDGAECDTLTLPRDPSLWPLTQEIPSSTTRKESSLTRPVGTEWRNSLN